MDTSYKIKIGKLYRANTERYFRMGTIVMPYKLTPIVHTEEGPDWKGLWKVSILYVRASTGQTKTMDIQDETHGSWFCSFEPIEWDITRKHPKFGR